MLKLNQIKTSLKFGKFNIISNEQKQAIEQQSLEYGQIFPTIYVWKETKQTLYGDHLIEIAQKHPELGYTIIEVSLQTEMDAGVWITEYLLPQPYLSLWQKLVLTIDCEDCWELKERAKRAQGTRNDLHSGAEGRLPSDEVNKIIAQKVGCSPTLVFYFKSVYHSGKKDLSEKCENGEMSISTAYECLKGKKKSKPQQPTEEPLVVHNLNIIAENSKNIDVGKKNTTIENGTPPDPQPVLEKIQRAKVADGAFWLVFHQDRGVFQVVKKSLDAKTGKLVIKLDAFKYRPVKSKDANVLIIEADHINFSDECLKTYSDGPEPSRTQEVANAV